MEWFSKQGRTALPGLLFFVLACKAATMHATLNMVVFNYLDRPIHHVFVDGKGGDSSGPYPHTGGSTISGVALNMGPQKISWVLDGPKGTPRNGETVIAKNRPVLKPAPGDRYMGVHIYRDGTVALTTSQFYPEESPRGIADVRKQE